MKRIVRLTESDLTRIVRRVIMEQGNPQAKSENELYNLIRAAANNSGSVGVSEGEITVSKDGTTIYSYDCYKKIVTYNPKQFNIGTDVLNAYCVKTNYGKA
jgi:hypothetical protein